MNDFSNSTNTHMNRNTNTDIYILNRNQQLQNANQSNINLSYRNFDYLKFKSPNYPIQSNISAFNGVTNNYHQEMSSHSETETISKRKGRKKLNTSVVDDETETTFNEKRGKKGGLKKNYHLYTSDFQVTGNMKSLSSKNRDHKGSAEEEETLATHESDKIERIEKIYAFRVFHREKQYLTKMKNGDCILTWINETHLSNIVNFKTMINKFEKDPKDMSKIDTYKDTTLPYPVSHRRTDDEIELLFRFTLSGTVIFYWDFAKQDIVNCYFRSRVSIPIEMVKDLSKRFDLNLIDSANSITKDNQQLKEYQIEGIRWLLGNWLDERGSMLADEMGLGKTIQALGFLHHLVYNFRCLGPFLIVVRSNCLKQWIDEIRSWTDLSHISYNGGPEQRRVIRSYQFYALDAEGNPIPRRLSFNILLVSYDIFAEDSVHLSRFHWQVVIVDEGHCIKNQQGKKNEMLTQLRAEHKIILTGTPIQNNLEELWALMRFISPNVFNETPEFIKNEDKQPISKEDLSRFQKMICPHIKRRTVQSVEGLSPKVENICFIKPSQMQSDLFRLIKLHAVRRLKGVVVIEEQADSSHESNDLHKTCMHPFLVDGFYEYYIKNGEKDREQLLLKSSSKFQWLDKILATLKKDGRKVLLFSQSVELLKLVEELLCYRKYCYEILIGEMQDNEKQAAVNRFTNYTDRFIFLISTRSGSEGLNLTVASVAIIFDPDWNPQNDIQAQASVHGIGQMQEVTIIRLVTFQSYEHEIFIRAQKKLELWWTLLGEKPPVQKSIEIPDPPEIVCCNWDITMSFQDALKSVSSIVPFCLGYIESLSRYLDIQPNNMTSDSEFLESFNVISQEKSDLKRSHGSSVFGYTTTVSLKIISNLMDYGYGRWSEMVKSFGDLQEDFVKRFCLLYIVLCFRLMLPTNIFVYPILISRLFMDIPGFTLDLICCDHDAFGSNLSDYFHSYEISACGDIGDRIDSDKEINITLLEYDLLANLWKTLNVDFNFYKLTPPRSETDNEKLEEILNFKIVDLYDERIIEIIEKMKYDIISLRQDQPICKFSFWTHSEFSKVLSTLKSYPFHNDDKQEFYARTGLLSKNIEDVCEIVRTIKNQLRKRNAAVNIPLASTKLNNAPNGLRNFNLTHSWTQLTVEESDELYEKMVILSAIREKIDNLPIEISKTPHWSIYHDRLFLEYILKFGTNFIYEILTDPDLPFHELLTPEDLESMEGTCEPKNIPFHFISEGNLIEYLDVDTSKRANEDEELLYFFIPSVKRIKFSSGSVKKQSQRDKRKRSKYISNDVYE